MNTGHRDRHRRSVTEGMYVYVAFLVKRLYGRSGVSGGVYGVWWIQCTKQMGKIGVKG